MRRKENTFKSQWELKIKKNQTALNAGKREQPSRD